MAPVGARRLWLGPDALVAAQERSSGTPRIAPHARGMTCCRCGDTETFSLAGCRNENFACEDSTVPENRDRTIAIQLEQRVELVDNAIFEQRVSNVWYM